MNGTSITVSVIVLLAVVAFGGYFIFTNYVSPGLAGQEPALVTSDDVRVQDITVGDGAGAVPGSIVSVLYVGMLEDGSVFDSSEAYDNEPLVFTLGDPGLIAGFQFGVNGMREGGERVMVVPPSLGYGAQEIQGAEGNVIIPANSTLIFNVRLLNVTIPETEAPPEAGE